MVRRPALLLKVGWVDGARPLADVVSWLDDLDGDVFAVYYGTQDLANDDR